MAAATNLTKSTNIGVTAREVDFVTSFSRNWEALREILGIVRPIKKENGTTLKYKTASITLQSGAVGEGEEIPNSLATVTETSCGTITLQKYKKSVSIEAVNDKGAEAAIEMTDEAFLNELQGGVLDKFYTFLATGTLTSTESTFQMGLAMAIGRVKNKFKAMRRTSNGIVAFVNTLDAYKYLGAAELSVQTAFGIDYLKNFMGAGTVILSSDIAEGKIIATPVENIVMYYVDPSNEGFQSLGLVYTVDEASETPLIGFHANGDYSHAVGESYALMGLTLFAEYLDAVAV